ncbi:MAG TPA: hypothetical protein VG498_10950 [Terriglobales bacterium]|nr:hypothetical protein [Terriglobales bacterium]
MRRIAALIVLFCFTSGASCLREDSVPELPKTPIPESGYVSPRQYTNAFFGFSLSIPGGCRFQIFDEKDQQKPLEHFLFGEKCPEKGLTTFGISAIPALGAADDEAQKAVLLPSMGNRSVPEALSVGGRLFWKNAVEEKTLWNQKIWRAHYATVARGFVVSFWMSSYSSKLAADLRQALESIKFFDPARAQEVAGADSHPYLPSAARLRIQNLPDVDVAHLDPGKVHGNLYVNPWLGFSYQFPEGWVRSARAYLQATSEKSSADSDSRESQTTHEHCIRALVAFTQYDEKSRGIEFNPRISILAADPSCFIPDMKFPTSLEDKGDIEGYGQALVRSLGGTRLIGQHNIRLFGSSFDGHIFLEVPSSNAEPVAGSTLLRKIHTELILTSIRNAWVIWLFESDDESELGKLLKTSISFVGSGPANTTP